MNGFIVVAPEVLIARILERGKRRFAPSLEFIRWRLEQLREEVEDDAAFWGIPVRDICLTRAAQIAEARKVSQSVTVAETPEVRDESGVVSLAFAGALGGDRVESK